MSTFELINAFIALLALLASLVTWFGQRKLQREANDLQRATSKLAEQQLQILERQERGRGSARLRVELVPNGRGWQFVLANVGEAEARNVDLRFVLEHDSDSPIISSEYAEKFPLPKLPSGSRVTLIAAMHLGGPSAFNLIIGWTNPAGDRMEEDAYVTR